MTLKSLILLFLFCAGLSLNPLSAGEYNEVLSIGDAAPAWEKLPGVDGKLHSLADLKEKQVVVVAFICNSCDVSADYEDRLIEFTNQHAGPDSPVAVVAINVNTVAADLPPKMKERAAAKKYPFPYLFDESQKIGKAYGANFTPEIFVLDKNRQVVYMGGIDDNSDPKQVKQSYLGPAVQAALKGEPPAVKEAPAIGCRIRYASERRKKKSS